MYYEIERLLNQGEKVIMTGLKGTGKSTLASKLSPRFDTFRSTWYVSQIIEGSLMDKYKLFDRCNYVDRYAFQYRTSDALEACIDNFREDFEGTYLLLMFYDKWSEERDFEGEFTDPERRKQVIARFLEIGLELYNRHIIKGLIVNYHHGWMSTDFYKVEQLENKINEEYLNG